MIGLTLGNTYHGNPGDRWLLPVGLWVRLRLADNLPQDVRTTGIRYWAEPLPGYPWPVDTARWAEGPGVGLHATDVETVETVEHQSLIEYDTGSQARPHT